MRNPFLAPVIKIRFQRLHIECAHGASRIHAVEGRSFDCSPSLSSSRCSVKGIISGGRAEPVSILPHDRRGRLQPNTYGAALIDKGTLGGDAPDDILGGQYRRHPPTTFRCPRGLRFSGLKRSLTVEVQLSAGSVADAQAHWAWLAAARSGVRKFFEDLK
jgi:hypothetical protein